MKNRVLKITFIGVIIIVLISVIHYSKVYSIEDNEAKFKETLSSITKVPIDEIYLLQELKLDNKKYASLTINGALGDVILIKGFNNKYKIESVSYGTNSFRHRIIETNGGKYLILNGINAEMKIAAVQANIENEEYMIEISSTDENYISCCKVNNKTSDKYLDISKVKFFDNNGIDITDKISLNID